MEACLVWLGVELGQPTKDQVATHGHWRLGSGVPRSNSVEDDQDMLQDEQDLPQDGQDRLPDDRIGNGMSEHPEEHRMGCRMNRTGGRMNKIGCRTSRVGCWMN